MNIDAHWYRRRTGTWSVRFEWTGPDGRQWRRTANTLERSLVDAHNCTVVQLFLLEIDPTLRKSKMDTVEKD